MEEKVRQKMTMHMEEMEVDVAELYTSSLQRFERIGVIPIELYEGWNLKEEYSSNSEPLFNRLTQHRFTMTLILRVRYPFLNKEDGGLQGTIKGSGILCFCSRCNGGKVLTAYEFERHAGTHLNQSFKRLKVEDVKDVSGINENIKGDDEILTCREESDPNSVKLPISDAVDVDMGKSETPVESVNAEVSEEAEGGDKLEVPDVPLETNEGQNVPLEKPLRRFTRSLLKPKEEVSASGSTTSEANSSSNSSSRNRLEMKMSKKIALNKLPSNIRDLLETGLLEGLPVRYLFLNKKDGGLQGTIKDSRILCFCSRCNGGKVVSAYEFERHAGSSQKHDSNNIYLENGNTLRDVFSACRDAPMDHIGWLALREKTASTLQSPSLPETNQENQSLSKTTQEERQSLFEKANKERQCLLVKDINIFHELFSPIIDAKTGRDFIPAMVKGEKIGDQDCILQY